MPHPNAAITRPAPRGPLCSRLLASVVCSSRNRNRYRNRDRRPSGQNPAVSSITEPERFGDPIPISIWTGARLTVPGHRFCPIAAITGGNAGQRNSRPHAWPGWPFPFSLRPWARKGISKAGRQPPPAPFDPAGAEHKGKKTQSTPPEGQRLTNWISSEAATTYRATRLLRPTTPAKPTINSTTDPGSGITESEATRNPMTLTSTVGPKPSR